jgi:hypothetical protein
VDFWNTHNPYVQDRKLVWFGMLITNIRQCPNTCYQSAGEPPEEWQESLVCYLPQMLLNRIL